MSSTIWVIGDCRDETLKPPGFLSHDAGRRGWTGAGVQILSWSCAERIFTDLCDQDHGHFLLIRGRGNECPSPQRARRRLDGEGGTAERSAELLKVVAEQTGGKPVQVLFNTHWHLENTGSNDTLGKAGAKIIAHENTKLWMTTEFHVQWQNRTYKPRAKEAGPTRRSTRPGKDDLRQRRNPIRPSRSGPHGRRYLCVLSRAEHPGDRRPVYCWKLSDPGLVHGRLDRCEGASA